MRVVHLSTTDFGGAYKAADRISRSMQIAGVDSELLIRTKINPDTNGEAYFKLPTERFFSKVKNVGNLLRSRGEIISDYYGENLLKHPKIQNADIVVLHWVNSFVSYNSVKQLATKKPVVIVMHDMWLFTGGCHCDRYCGGYENGCTECPMLAKHEVRIASNNFSQKKDMLRNGNITLVGPSDWIVGEASKSRITDGKKIYRIFNPIETEIFKPVEKVKKTSKKKILFGAMKADNDSNKGINRLITALKKLPREQYEIVIFGNQSDYIFPEVGLHCTLLGQIADEKKIADIYREADVFVAPSLQESFGYTVCEALACGTPVVAFAVGGILNQITHKKNGYLAKIDDIDDLANGIVWCVNESYNKGDLRVINNGLSEIGDEYVNLCKRLLDEL